MCQLVNCYSNERFGLKHSRVRLDSKTNKNTVHKTRVISIMSNWWEWFNLKYVDEFYMRTYVPDFAYTTQMACIDSGSVVGLATQFYLQVNRT